MSTAVPALPATSPPTLTALQSGRREGWMFQAVCGGAAWSSVVMLAILLAVGHLMSGAGRLSWQFLTSFDSAVRRRRPASSPGCGAVSG